MPKKPKFLELPESEFNNQVETIEQSTTRPTPPRIRRPSAQTEESKFIKRTNEQVKLLYNYIPGQDNDYIASFLKAYKAAGVETTKKMVNGQVIEVVRNTKENREKVAQLQRALYEENAQSMSDIRKRAREHLKEKGIKATKTNLDNELDTMSAYATLESNLSFAYNKKASGSTMFDKYVDNIRGRSRKNDPQGFDQAVRDFRDAVQNLRSTERDLAYAESMRVDEDLPY